MVGSVSLLYGPAAPLRDRINRHVEGPSLSVAELRADRPAETSASIRARIQAARARQQARLAGPGTPGVNARMSHAQIRRDCALPAALGDLLQQAMERLALSARAYDRILKVARTIADLDASTTIAERHLLEAIHYRNLDRRQAL